MTQQHCAHEFNPIVKFCRGCDEVNPGYKEPLKPQSIVELDMEKLNKLMDAAID